METAARRPRDGIAKQQINVMQPGQSVLDSMLLLTRVTTLPYTVND